MNWNHKKLPLLIGILGTAALALRLALFRLGTDDKGLLIPWHPLDLLVWAVTAAAFLAASAVVYTRNLSNRYADCFPPSITAALGALILAAGIALSTLDNWAAESRMELLRNITGLMAVPVLIWLALCRSQGKQPPFALHGVLCLHLILFTISRYQNWCSQPQLQNYFFTMLGAIGLTLSAYYRTAFDAGLGKPRAQRLTGLMAAFFCLAALANGEDLPLYLTGAFWSLTNLCCLTPKEPPHESA